MIRIVCQDGYQHQVEYETLYEAFHSMKDVVKECKVGPHSLLVVEECDGDES